MKYQFKIYVLERQMREEENDISLIKYRNPDLIPHWKQTQKHDVGRNI